VAAVAPIAPTLHLSELPPLNVVIHEENISAGWNVARHMARVVAFRQFRGIRRVNTRKYVGQRAGALRRNDIRDHFRVRYCKEVRVRRRDLHQKTLGWRQRGRIAGLPAVATDNELITCDTMSALIVPPVAEVLNRCEAARTIKHLSQLIYRIRGRAGEAGRHRPRQIPERLTLRRIGGRPPRQQIRVIRRVDLQGDSDLVEIADTFRALAFFFCSSKSWKKHRGQDRNNRYNNQQFDQCESSGRFGAIRPRRSAVKRAHIPSVNG